MNHFATFAFTRASIEGKRVALIGKGAHEAASGLTPFAPRMVMVFDPTVRSPFDTLRPVPVTVHPLTDEDFDVRAGAFDTVFLVDVASLPPLHRFLPRVRKVLATSGVVFASAELGEHRASYEELYEFFSMQFEHLKMLGVLPFHGVSFVELGAEEPDVSVDTEFGASDAPTKLLVCASGEPIETESYAIVATQAESTVIEHMRSISEAPTVAFSMTPPPQPGNEAEVAALSLRNRMLETQLEDALARANAARSARDLEARITELQGEIEERERRLAASEDRAREYATQAQRVGMEVERLREDVQRREQEAREMTTLIETRQEQQDKRIEQTLAEQKVTHEQLFARKLEQALRDQEEKTEARIAEATRAAHREGEIAALEAAHEEETTRLETTLAGCAKELAAARAESMRLSKLVKELVLAQDFGVYAGAPTPLHQKLDALADALALAHAEIEGQRWHMKTLELTQENPRADH